MKHIILDIEVSCCEELIVDTMEVIEIAAIVVDDGVEIGHFQSYVKPIKNHKLTDFCITNTKIKQSCIDDAPDLKTVIKEMDEWITDHRSDGGEICWSTWVSNTRFMLLKQLVEEGYRSILIDMKYINLSEEYRKKMGIPRRRGTLDSKNLMGLNFSENNDSPLNDVRRILGIMNSTT